MKGKGRLQWSVSTAPTPIMATRRSQRAAGLQLSNRLGDIADQAKQQVLNDQRAARESKYAHTRAKFRFMDLLPELRLRIYGFAMTTEEPRDLTDIKAPTLAMVSKQVRAEAFPVFFSDCVFATTVKSNYVYVDRIDASAARNTLANHRPRGRNLAPTRIQEASDGAGYILVYN